MPLSPMIHTSRTNQFLRRWVSTCVLVLLSGQPWVISALSAAETDQSLAVLMTPRPEAVRLSPDASRLAIIMRGDSLLRLQSLETSEVQTALLPSEGRLHTLRWVDEGRLVLLWQTDAEVKIYQLILTDVGQSLGSLRRLAQMDSSASGQLRVVSSQHDSLWLSHDVRRNGQPDLFRLDLNSGRLSFDRSNPGSLFRWFYHPASKMQMGWFWQRASNGPSYQLRYLASGHSQWNDLITHTLLEPAITVLGFNDGGGSVDILTEHAGDETSDFPYQIMRLSLDGMNRSQEMLRMAAPPRQLIWSDNRQAVEYRETGSLSIQSRSVSPGWKARLARLSQLSTTADPVWQGGGLLQRFSLWRLEFPDQPAHWRLEDDQGDRSRWLFDRNDRSRASYHHERHSVAARDGLRLEAFMARPLLSTEPAPTVLLVHGGPWARDQALYRDDLALLTAQGFNVLRVNYRGTRGNGHDLFLAGVREWGEGMREDLDDVLAAMISKGLVDPERVCIMGHSYGGFAALNAVMRDSHPYRCAVAFAPVTNVPEQIRQFRARRHERAFQEWQTMVGVPAQLSAMQSISPMQRADQLEVPVLIAHGAADQRVLIAQSVQLVQSLQQLNKPAQWLEMKQADHQLSDQSNRLHYYNKAITFLRLHLLQRSTESVSVEIEDRLPARNSTP